MAFADRSLLVVACAAIASQPAACGRSKGVPDQELGGLVIAAKPSIEPIDVSRAATDPVELGRALVQPHRALITALGPHVVTLATDTEVDEAGKPISDLSDHTTLELGEHGAFHALTNNSADYGREVTFVDGKLYLRPRYQRWHARDPEAADEPDQLRERFYDAVAATWDLVAPAGELTDLGAVQVGNRAGRKIAIKRSSSPQAPPSEAQTQRKWREHRTIDALSGEVVLDADKGVPLSIRIAGTVSFTREGRAFTMKVSVASDLTSLGMPAVITAPPTGDVVATPERLREVDDRDFLLEGIAPAQRKGAAKPAPAQAPVPVPVPAPKSQPTAKPVPAPKAAPP